MATTPSRPARAARPLRFATYLAPALYPVYEAIVAYVGRGLGRPVTLAVGTSFEQFVAGEVDAGFI